MATVDLNVPNSGAGTETSTAGLADKWVQASASVAGDYLIQGRIAPSTWVDLAAFTGTSAAIPIEARMEAIRVYTNVAGTGVSFVLAYRSDT